MMNKVNYVSKELGPVHPVHEKMPDPSRLPAGIRLRVH